MHLLFCTSNNTCFTVNNMLDTSMSFDNMSFINVCIEFVLLYFLFNLYIRHLFLWIKYYFKVFGDSVEVVSCFNIIILKQLTFYFKLIFYYYFHGLYSKYANIHIGIYILKMHYICVYI